MKKFKYVNKDNLFYCYSINLYHFMSVNGFKHVEKDINPSTGKTYWVYPKTSEFLEALTYFTNQKRK